MELSTSQGDNVCSWKFFVCDVVSPPLRMRYKISSAKIVLAREELFVC